MAPHGAATPVTEVTMPGQRFTPPRATILVGEAVLWRNFDSARHTVTADDDSFDSGSISPGGQFEHRFENAGTYAYACSIHRFMRGTVEVASLALVGPTEPARPGETVTLEGRGPAGSGTVTLERSGVPVATTRADDHGAFRFDVVADTPASYRARSGDLSSGAVAVGVAPHVTLAARRAGRSVRARIQVHPPQPGARVVLERYVRERFGYRRVRGVTLDAQSGARLVVRSRRRLRLRARLAIPVDGYSRSIGNVVVVPRRGASSVRDHRH